MSNNILLKTNVISILQILMKKDCTVKIISKQTKIPRASCYRIIKKLEKEQLIYQIDNIGSPYAKIFRSTKSKYVIHMNENKITIN